MLVKVYPSVVSGNIPGPPSKSCTQRALAAALIKRGVSVIENAGKSNDEMAARAIIQALGADLQEVNNILTVTVPENVFRRNPDSENLKVVNGGESGLSMRMFAPITALFDYEIQLTGEGSILTRPMDFLDNYLPQLNVSIKSNDGKLPITIKGPLIPEKITVDGGFSSQFITGMIYAYCSAVKEKTTIEVQNLTSRPYIDLTLSVLEKFGYRIVNNNYSSFDIFPSEDETPKTVRYAVEGDWSNAAFLLVSGAVSNGVTVTGMDLQSTQGDKRILEALRACGAQVETSDNSIRISGIENMHGFEFDATHCPDLFPPLVALASNCGGTTVIKGVHRLLHKESNRAVALQEEFGKMNIRIDVDGDVMTIHGGNKIRSAKVSSHNDHRIAMAATVAGLNADGIIEISGAEAINKSYPGFYEDMKKLGADIRQ